MFQASDINIFDRSTFDKLADFYEYFVQTPYRARIEIPTIDKELGDLMGKNIFDFGCGPGVFTRWLAAKKAQHIVGYDISAGMLDHAITREQKEKLCIEYRSQLSSDLMHQFDLVLSLCVLCYSPSEDALYEISQNISSLIKDNGRALILITNPDVNPDGKYYQPYGFNLIGDGEKEDGSIIRVKMCQPPPFDKIDDIVSYYWSKNTINNNLKKAGFSKVIWRPWETSQLSTEEKIFFENYLLCPALALICAYK